MGGIPEAEHGHALAPLPICTNRCIHEREWINGCQRAITRCRQRTDRIGQFIRCEIDDALCVCREPVYALQQHGKPTHDDEADSRRGIRRCRSYWLCGIGGWVLGVTTGVLGASAISTTTVAVEQVVLRHLEHQLEQLRGSDPAAVAAIAAIIEDEQQHHDRSTAHARAGAFWPRVLTPVVTASTEAVIWVGMRA